MDSLAIIGTVIGSAAFGAVAGKLLDAFVLTRISDKYERKKWLRQTKIEAFTQLTEKMLSLGIKGQVHDDPWRFRALAAKAILLLDDPKLVEKIQTFIDELYKINTGLYAAISNLPENFSVELPSGSKATKKDFEKGFALNEMEKEAIKIADQLAKNLRET
jgi:hypothetical protein